MATILRATAITARTSCHLMLPFSYFQFTQPRRTALRQKLFSSNCQCSNQTTTSLLFALNLATHGLNLILAYLLCVQHSTSTCSSRVSSADPHLGPPRYSTVTVGTAQLRLLHFRLSLLLQFSLSRARALRSDTQLLLASHFTNNSRTLLGREGAERLCVLLSVVGREYDRYP